MTRLIVFFRKPDDLYSKTLSAGKCIPIFTNPGLACIARHIYSLCEDSNGNPISECKWKDPNFLVKEGHSNLVKWNISRATKLDKILSVEKVIPRLTFTLESATIVAKQGDVQLLMNLLEFTPLLFDLNVFTTALASGVEDMALYAINYFVLYRNGFGGDDVIGFGPGIDPSIIHAAILSGSRLVFERVLSVISPFATVSQSDCMAAIQTNSTKILDVIKKRCSLQDHGYKFDWKKLYKVAGSMTNDDIKEYIDDLVPNDLFDGISECEISYLKGSMRTHCFERRFTKGIGSIQDRIEMVDDYLIDAIKAGNIPVIKMILAAHSSRPTIEGCGFIDINYKNELIRAAFDTDDTDILDLVSSYAVGYKYLADAVGIYLRFWEADKPKLLNSLTWCISKEGVIQSLKEKRDYMQLDALSPPILIELIKAGLNFKTTRLLLYGISNNDLWICEHAKTLFPTIDSIFIDVCISGYRIASLFGYVDTMKWVREVLKEHDITWAPMPNRYWRRYHDDAFKKVLEHKLDIMTLSDFTTALRFGYNDIIYPEFFAPNAITEWHSMMPIDAADVAKPLLYSGNIYLLNRFFAIFPVKKQHLDAMILIAAYSKQWTMVFYLIKKGGQINEDILPQMITSLVAEAKHDTALTLFDHTKTLSSITMEKILLRHHYFVAHTMFTKFPGYDAVVLLNNIRKAKKRYMDEFFISTLVQCGTVSSINLLKEVCSKFLPQRQIEPILKIARANQRLNNHVEIQIADLSTKPEAKQSTDEGVDKNSKKHKSH